MFLGAEIEPLQKSHYENKKRILKKSKCEMTEKGRKKRVKRTLFEIPVLIISLAPRSEDKEDKLTMKKLQMRTM